MATLVSVVALLFLAAAASPDAEVGFTGGHYAVLALAAAAAALALAGHLAALLDAAGRSLQDRLLGLVVERVGDAAPQPAGSPRARATSASRSERARAVASRGAATERTRPK